MRFGRIGGRFRTGATGPFRTFMIVAFLVLLVLAAGFLLSSSFALGLDEGRRSLAGGYLANLGQVVTFVPGFIVSLLLGAKALSLRRRNPRLGVLIVVGLAIGWLGWVAGNAVAIAQGHGAEYAGSAQISAGSQVLGSVPIRCASVVGAPTLLAGLGVQTNGFDLSLRHNIDRTLKPSIWGEAILPSGTVSFGAVDHVVADGLDGHATISSLVVPASGGPGSSTEVTIEWTCDPATQTPY